MKQGDWVLFDELNTALPEVLTVINGILDDSRSVTLPNKENERITAHKEFRFIGTQNPSSGEYAGTARLNNALLNRMVKVEIGYMSPDKEVEALKVHTKLKDGTLTVLVSIAGYTRREDNGFSEAISTRDLVKIIRLRDKGGLTVEQAIAIVLKDKYDNEEYNKLYRQFASRMMDLENLLGCRNREDPFDKLVERRRELDREKRALDEKARNLRDEIRREILRDLLKGTGSAVPADF
jgi:hypothetical protein